MPSVRWRVAARPSAQPLYAVSWVRYFFDVPVYRLAEHQYYEAREAFVRDNLRAGSEDPELQASFRSHLERSYGGPWQFNEIVGYVRLHFLGSQVRGEYFATSARRIVRTRKKVFWMQTHKLAPEMEIPSGASAEDISTIVSAYLSRCEGELKGRFLDRRMLDAISPHVDWRSLFDSV